MPAITFPAPAVDDLIAARDCLAFFGEHLK
jgi:hypothetical protein